MVRKEIREMDVPEYADDRDAEIDMSLNENPVGVSDRVMDAVKNISPREIYGYQHPSGATERFATFLGEEREKLLLTDGCDGALEVISQTFFSRDTTVAIPVPCFPRYETHARKMGADTIFVEAVDGIHPSISTLSDVDADYMILANPQNPSGERFSLEELEKLKDGFDGKLILDEAMARPGRNHVSLVDEDVTLAGSFSKFFGLAGLRAGYIVSEYRDSHLKASSPFKINAAAQKAVEQVIEDEEYLEETGEKVEEELDYLKKNLDELGVRYSESVSLTVLLDFSEFGISGSDAHRLLLERGVKTTRGEHFRGLDSQYLRISVRDRKTNREFLERLRNLLEKAERGGAE